VDLSQLTHDIQELEALAIDPLHNRGQILNRTGNEVLKAQVRVNDLQEVYSLPFLALHGHEDTVTLPRGSEILFENSPSYDKTLKFYEGLYHEILLEVGKEKVEQDVIDFFNEHNPLLI